MGCSAVNCTVRGGGVTLFYFPKEEARKKLWTLRMKRGGKWKPSPQSRLCAQHFSDDQFRTETHDKYGRPYKVGRKTLKADAVPSLFSFVKEKAPRKPPPERRRRDLEVDSVEVATVDVENAAAADAIISKDEEQDLATSSVGTPKSSDKLYSTASQTTNVSILNSKLSLLLQQQNVSGWERN